MGKWLSQQIARQLGICANLDFPLPATYLWQLFEQLLPEVPHQDNYQPKRLAWRIYALLETRCDQPEYLAVKRYLSQGGELRRFQLAQNLALLFDQYQLYRPDWIQSWQAGESVIPDDLWQADLWRCLVANDARHWVSLQKQLYQTLEHPKSPHNLYPRVSIFGVPTLSPGYLEIVRLLANWVDVHLFLLNPCEAHWAEIVTPEEEARLSLAAPDEELYLDVGHPLLASLGRQGRDFFTAINEMDPGSTELFQAQPDGSLLHRLQNQMLTLEAPASACRADQSISLQRCHSPMREVEVLYDQLLSALQELPSLRPDEILIMTPDINRYGPLLEAVFSASGHQPKIPYRVSDATLRQNNPVADALLRILSLPGSRYGVSELIELLDEPTVRSRFGLDEEGLRQVILWLDQSAVRWGRDGANKLDFGLPAEERNTWRAGLRQLMLGYALPADAGKLWHGVYPLDAVEGSMTQWLGGLLAFSDAVFSLESLIGEVASPPQWHARLLQVIARFFEFDGHTEQAGLAVKATVDQLVQEAKDAGFDQPVPLSLIRHRLGELFEQSTDRGFLGGGINLCALAPMRSLPFRLIYLLGMNDGVFPRQQPEMGFNLMKHGFRPGDRSHRADDRYLFLETLISARDRLIISYQGYSQRDNTPMPASVVVEELRDLLQQMLEEGELEKIVQHHPLQPFSPDYFRSHHGLFSYSEEMREAAMLVGRGKAVDRPLLDQPLVTHGSIDVLELDQFLRFFENPQRAFAMERLGVKLETVASLPEAREPFTVDAFKQAELAQQIVTLLLEPLPEEKIFAQFDARGALPHGLAGKLLFEQMFQQAHAIARQLSPYQEQWLSDPVEVDIPIAGVRLRGHLQQVNRSGLLAYSTYKLYPHQLIKQWIRHLILNQLCLQGVSLESHLITVDKRGCFKPVEAAEHTIEAFIQAYQRGMEAPIPFYPGTSWQYVEKHLQGGDEEKALKEAAKKWFGSAHHAGDVAKPYNKLLYQGYPMDEAVFTEISLTLLQPLMAHLEWE
jgi:exodeoxyribonuclease V gamma subunit